MALWEEVRRGRQKQPLIRAVILKRQPRHGAKLYLLLARYLNRKRSELFSLHEEFASPLLNADDSARIDAVDIGFQQQPLCALTRASLGMADRRVAGK